MDWGRLLFTDESRFNLEDNPMVGTVCIKEGGGVRCNTFVLGNVVNLEMALSWCGRE